MMNVLRWSLLLGFILNAQGVASDYLSGEDYRKFLVTNLSSHFMVNEVGDDDIDEEVTEKKCEKDIRKNPLIDVSLEGDLPKIQSMLAMWSCFDDYEDTDISRFLDFLWTEHIERTRLDNPEEKILFFKKQTFLKEYFDDVKPCAFTKRLHFLTFMRAAQYYLKEADLENVQANLRKAAKLFPEEVKVGILYFVNIFLSLQEEIGLNIKNKKLIAKKFCDLYKRVLKEDSSQLDYIDYIYLMRINFHCCVHEDIIRFGELALKSCPKTISVEVIDQSIDENTIRSDILDAAYNTKNYDLYQRYFPMCQGSVGTNYVNKSVMEVEQEKYEEARTTLERLCARIKEADQRIDYSKTGREALAWLRLIKEYRANLKTEVLYFIQNHIKDIQFKFDEVNQNIQLLYKKYKEEKYLKIQKLIRQAMVIERHEAAKSFIKKYDLAYQSVWGLATGIENEGGHVLDSLDELGARLEEHYQTFFHLSERENAYEDLVTIIAAGDQLQEVWEEFSWEVSQVKLKIRDLKRSELGDNPAQAAMIPAGGYHYTKADRKGFYPKKIKGEEEIELRSKEKSFLSFEGSGTSATNASSMKGRMISFKNAETATIWKTRDARHYPPRVLEIMQALDQASNMRMLRLTLGAGSSLELLKGDREGQISLRINDQWRLCFRWETGVGAHSVEIVDYH